MRKRIVAGNWKMNLNFSEAEDLLNDMMDLLEERPADEETEVIVCTPAVYLEMATDLAIDGNFYVGAQNISPHEYGAYTGEISAPMLQSMGVTHTIVGHSERRTYFGETDSVIAEKINQALKYDLTPIYCCGEVLEERQSEKQFEVVKRQISEAMFHLPEAELGKIIIAYEPVWAIGTGLTATPGQAQEMHAFIRKIVAEKYGQETAENIPILYGGSCNAKNAAELFANPDVDGGLIGGASLKAGDFVAIIHS